MHKFVYQIAKSNKKLSKDHYKVMIKNSNLVPNRTPIYVFKEAFHSSNTPIEYRAMLLSSMYYDKPNYKSLLKTTTDTAKHLQNISLRVEESPQTGKYFSLVGHTGSKVKYGRVSGKKVMQIKLTKDIKAHIKQWEPKALSQQLLERGFRSNNIQFQKLTLSIEHISRFLFDFAYITKQFVFLNDPRKKYNISPIEALKRKWREAPFTGYFANSAETFKRHLEHMYLEFLKYLPTLEKLGIDTLNFEITYSELRSYLDEYVAGKYNNDTQEEEDVLYDIHRQAAPLVRAVMDMARKIESLTEYSPEILNINPNIGIPPYTPYKSNPTTIERSYEAVNSDEGVIIALAEFYVLLNK